MKVGPKTYGNASWAEIGRVALTLLQLPVIFTWKLLTSQVAGRQKNKSWRRTIGDTAFRILASTLNIRQFQFVLGTTCQVYEKWAAQNGLPSVIEEIGQDARLLWFGPKRTDRVVIYFHGGGYIIPMQYFAASFWNYIRVHLKEQKNIDTGFVVLNYSIVPTAPFPAQLTQAVLALQHIISSGVKPENLQIVGDSAGGNLALALLSNILHPLDGVPRISLNSPIRSVYIMSPWVSLTGNTGSHATNDPTDVVGVKTFAYCGRKVLAGVPKSQYIYLEASKAPDSWFKGVDSLVDRVLITAGGVECLRDDIAQVAKQICHYHAGARFIVQPGGVHNDPYFDFLVGEVNLCELTPIILDWLADGFM